MKWEYKIVQIDDGERLSNPIKLQEELNKFGTEDWEVIQVLNQEPIGLGWVTRNEIKMILLKRAIH